MAVKPVNTAEKLRSATLKMAETNRIGLWFFGIRKPEPGFFNLIHWQRLLKTIALI